MHSRAIFDWKVKLWRWLLLALLSFSACRPTPGTLPTSSPTAAQAGAPTGNVTSTLPVKPVQSATPRLPNLPALGGTLSPQDAALQAAVQDLAQRLAIDAAEIKLVSQAPDEFQAGDLGCPSKDNPAQPKPALVSGYTIVLETAGQTYLYHASGSKAVLCVP